MNAPPVRVLVVDDQLLVRHGISSLLALSDRVQVVGQAEHGRQDLDRIADLDPEVVLLDLRMPVLDGLGVLRALAGAADPPHVLVLTTFDDDEALLEAVGLGATGYLLKDVSLEQLVAAILEVAAGGVVVQPALTHALQRRVRSRPRSAADTAHIPDLTHREIEVLRMLTGGFSNKEIAVALHLAEGTVKNHVSAILLKLGTRDRTRAVLRAIEEGLV